MKIEIAEGDLLRLRFIAEHAHDAIGAYPVMQNQNHTPGFEGTIAQCKADQSLLRKLYRKLTKALERSAIGHDCNACSRMQMP